MKEIKTYDKETQHVDNNKFLITESVINELFKNLLGLFPQALTVMSKNQANMNDIKSSWTDAFLEKKITSEMLENGISQLRDSKSKFFPSLPEFIALCKKNPLIPDADEVMSVYHRYIHHYSDDGSFDWKNNNLMYHIVLEIRKCNPLQNKLQDTLEMILREYTAKIEEGWVPSAPPKVLSKPNDKPLDNIQEEAKRQVRLYQMAALKAKIKSYRAVKK